MSSSKTRNVLLVTFVVLTLVFGSLSIYDSFQIEQLKSSSIATSTTTMTLTPSTTFTVTTSIETMVSTSTITATATKPYIFDEGNIYFSDTGWFTYLRLPDMPAGTSVTFRNVTFYSIQPNETISVCTHIYIKATFQDGTSEIILGGWCMTLYGNPIPSIKFTNHSNPKAGIIFSSNYASDGKVTSSLIAQGIYLMVSGRS